MASASEGQREGEGLVWNRGFRSKNKTAKEKTERGWGAAGVNFHYIEYI